MSLIGVIYKTKKPLPRNSDVNQRTRENVQDDRCLENEIQCWQGRWDLHRWLEKVYETKGGKCGEYTDDNHAVDFNGMSLEIDENTLDDWEQICEDHKRIPMYFDDESVYLHEDLRTITKCRKAFDEGYNIYYWPAY